MSDYTIIAHYQPPKRQPIPWLQVRILALFLAHFDASVRVTVLKGSPDQNIEGGPFDLEEQG